jgi:hypothetical protein
VVTVVFAVVARALVVTVVELTGGAVEVELGREVVVVSAADDEVVEADATMSGVLVACASVLFRPANA